MAGNQNPAGGNQQRNHDRRHALLEGAHPAQLPVLMRPAGHRKALTFTVARWAHQNRELRWVRAFKQGMAPIVIALLIATGWILVASHGSSINNWPLWLLTAVTALLIWRTLSLIHI